MKEKISKKNAAYNTVEQEARKKKEHNESHHLENMNWKDEKEKKKE